MENLHNQKNNEKLVAISEKYMLTIREAGSYFNIGIKNMRRLCESNEGEFSIRWGNKYLICRPRLEAYLNQLMVREQNQNDIWLEETHARFENNNLTPSKRNLDFFVDFLEMAKDELWNIIEEEEKIKL